MVLLWVSIAIGAILGLVFGTRDLGWGFGIFAGVMGGVFGFLISLMISIPLEAIGGSHWEAVDTQNIVNITDDSNIHGAFFLFAGYVNEDPVFKFYTEDNGNYRLEWEYADYVTIRQDSSQPRIITYTKVADWEWAGVMGFNDYTYTIHVPEGSIKQQFVLGD